MTGHGTLALRTLGWALLVGGVVGLPTFAVDSKMLGIASVLSGIVCWATFTTAADFVDYAAARLARIEANTKRMADALEQGLR